MFSCGQEAKRNPGLRLMPGRGGMPFGDGGRRTNSVTSRYERQRSSEWEPTMSRECTRGRVSVMTYETGIGCLFMVAP